ncbi:MAG: endoglucanase, partial [Clostridiales bacterium]|nr:endoglucanase [Clostridiales bacterium]
DFEDKNEVSSYLSYSNRFIDNTKDHRQGYTEIDDTGKYHMQVTGWNREALKGLEEDMNHYICADVVFSDHKVCTVFAKTSEPEGFKEEVLSLAKTLEPVRDGEAKDGIRTHWAEETAEIYDRYFGEESGFTWGVFKWGIDEDWSRLTQLENRLEHSFEILLYYSHFESSDSLERIRRVLTSAQEEGRTVELTLQTKFSEEGNMVYDILNGEYDEYIRDYAKLLAELKIPVLFRLCNEMNGDWCEYSAYHTSRDTEIFNDMYRYIFGIFMEEGAGAYTIWVWNPNERSFPDYKWNHEYNYYPGDEYVDVIGITGYNTGTYYEGEVWRSFDEIYEPVYERTLDNYSKPIMITEFGCAQAGGDKEEWVEDMYESIKGYSRIKAAVWWDGCDYDEYGNVARSYLIEENEDMVELFKKGFGDID